MRPTETIGELAYEPYGLTDEEVQIVEADVTNPAMGDCQVGQGEGCMAV